jgi:hypothetical protein
MSIDWWGRVTSSLNIGFDLWMSSDFMLINDCRDFINDIDHYYTETNHKKHLIINLIQRTRYWIINRV